MTEPTRRSLLGALERKSTPVSEEVIAIAAEQHGFTTPAAPVAPARPAPDFLSAPRRQRQPKGRTEQFNVRLRPETVALIYGESNGRDIPLAQVIEEALEAYMRDRAR